MRHVLTMDDVSSEDLVRVLDAAERKDPKPVLSGQGVALVFEHPSARTRNAAEMAVVQLGGHPVSIRGEEVGLDKRESTEDVARTLACYHAMIGARVVRHETLERMAMALGTTGPVSVVNLLSDVEHPSQALADLLTIRQEFGSFGDRRVAFIGDANNVARSLVTACVLAGMSVRVASPEGYTLGADALARAKTRGGEVQLYDRAEDAAEGADVLYTDVWVSMGEEDRACAKRAAFAGFGIDEHLVELANKDAIVLHCLPAHRGEEIQAEVIDGAQSRVWPQAVNRMHALRGLFLVLAEDAGEEGS